MEAGTAAGGEKVRIKAEAGKIRHRKDGRRHLCNKNGIKERVCSLMLNENTVSGKTSGADHVRGHMRRGKFLYIPQIIHQGSFKVLGISRQQSLPCDVTKKLLYLLC